MNHSGLTLDKWVSKPWLKSTWMGVPILQTPVDLHLEQEVIYRTKPSLIVETGTYAGGHAMYLSSLIGVLGRVVSIGLPLTRGVKASRGAYTHLEMRSLDPYAIGIVEDMSKDERVMVILDSDHSADNVRAELDAYSRFVTPGQYLIVCDGTAVPGPLKAVQGFLEEHPEFDVDEEIDRFGLSNHFRGWLQRRA